MATSRPLADHGGVTHEGRPSRASLPGVGLPPQVVTARDALFRDADRHGPRLPDLLRRAVPGLVLPPLAVALAASGTWRQLLVDRLPASLVDVLLVAPVALALVALAAALAPLARMRSLPLLATGVTSAGVAALLVAGGWIVLASIPAAVGAVVLGASAARAVRRAVWAMPVLLVAGISDAQSVSRGVTQRLLEDGSFVGGTAVAQVEPLLRVAPASVLPVDFLVLHVPVATGTWLLGAVDVFALGLLLGLAHVLWLPLGRTAIALAIALGIALAVGTTVAVLPALGAAWLLAHASLVWRATRFSLRRLTYLGG